LDSEGPKEMEEGVGLQKTSEVALRASAKKTARPKGSEGEGMDLTPPEGRGDPASTMLWSPRKHAGHKRPLESEEEISEGECRAPLQKGCPKHQGHKGDPGVTPGTCGAGGEKA
jgi:hypothetical protein